MGAICGTAKNTSELFSVNLKNITLESIQIAVELMPPNANKICLGIKNKKYDNSYPESLLCAVMEQNEFKFIGYKLDNVSNPNYTYIVFRKE